MKFKRMFEVGTLTEITNPKTRQIYYLLSVLGKGGHGTVFVVVDPETDTEYAAKLVDLTDVVDYEAFLEEAERPWPLRPAEGTHRVPSAKSYQYLSMLPDCQPGIVCLLDGFITRLDGTRIGVLVSEMMDGDIEKIPLKWYEVVPMFKSILEGLAFMHKQHIAHRDIKPGNILRRGQTFKVADMGLVCTDEYDEIGECTSLGTEWYLSPEGLGLWQHSVPLDFAQSQDVWALGIVLLEALFGRILYGDLGELEDLNQSRIKRVLDSAQFAKLQLTNITPQQLKTLIEHMLVLQSYYRPTAKQLLNELNGYIKENRVPPLEPDYYEEPFAYFEPR